jgi:hypothetical protein
MKLFYVVAAVVALARVPANADTDRQAPAEVTPNEARIWLALFAKVVDTVVVNRDDCGKMATSLDAVIDANQDAIAIARDAKAKGKRLPASAKEKVLQGMQRMVAALDKCGRDDKVAAAFQRLDLGNRK